MITTEMKIERSLVNYKGIHRSQSVPAEERSPAEMARSYRAYLPEYCEELQKRPDAFAREFSEAEQLLNQLHNMRV